MGAAMPLDGTLNAAAPVVERVAQEFGLDPAQLVSKRRDRDTVRARWAVFIILRDRYHWTLAHIARHFDGHDHTSVRHGLAQAARMMSDDDEYRAKIIAAGQNARPIEPAPIADGPGLLDYVVIDRLTQQMREAWKSKLRNNPDAFRKRYAKTYKRVREAVR